MGMVIDREIIEISVLDAVAANGTSPVLNADGAVLNVGQYKDIGFSLVGDNGANLTVKVKGAKSKIAPDFTAAVSPTNQWFYVQIFNNTTGNYLPGTTGIVFASDVCVGIDINNDLITYIALEVSGYAAGDVTASVVLADNS